MAHCLARGASDAYVLGEEVRAKVATSVAAGECAKMGEGAEHPAAQSGAYQSDEKQRCRDWHLTAQAGPKGEVQREPRAANASTLTCWPVHSGAGKAKRRGPSKCDVTP
jgi:hypothetical protein